MFTEFQKSQRRNKMIRKIMEMMEAEEFTRGEAEAIPQALELAIKKNSERAEKEKPFAIYREN